MHPAPPSPGVAPELKPLSAWFPNGDAPEELTLEHDADLVVDGFPRAHLAAGDVVLPFALARAVAEQRSYAKQLQPLCQDELDGLYEAWRAYTDGVVDVESKDGEVRAAEAVRDAAAEPWWLKWLMLGAGAAGGAVVAAVAVAAAMTPGVVVRAAGDVDAGDSVVLLVTPPWRLPP